MNAKTIAKRHGGTFAKYFVVGVSGTIIDVGLFTLLIAVTDLGNTLQGTIIAATISFILAATNNYTWNRLWTFAGQTEKKRTQFPKFLLVSTGGLILNVFFLTVFSHLFSALFIAVGTTMTADTLPTWCRALAKIGASGTVLIYNYGLNRYWTFKND